MYLFIRVVLSVYYDFIQKKTNDAELRTEPLNTVWSGLKAVSSLAKVKQAFYALVSFLLKWR